METGSLDKSITFSFLKEGGEMEKIFNSRLWKETSIGSPSAWPQSLKTTLNILFNSHFPSLLLWGTDDICFYNDSYKSFLDADIGHVEIFGQTMDDLLYDRLGLSKKIVDKIRSGTAFKLSEERIVSVFIKGEKKSIHSTFHYSPIDNDSGDTEGVFISCSQLADAGNYLYKPTRLDQQFQNLIYQSTVGILVLMGEEMRVEIVNDMYGRLIGRSPVELQGRELFSVIPEDEKVFRPIIDSVRNTGNPVFLYDKLYFIYTNGERKERYLNLVYQPYLEHDGSIRGVMVLCQDVTEHVNDKKKIIEAEEKARLAIDSADLGTYEIDLQSDEMKTSERFNKIWGVENQISRLEFASLIHPDDRGIREAAHRKSLKTGNLHYEARVIWKDRSQHWVKVKGKVLFDSFGKPVTLLGIIQDINEQKNIADDLTKLVQERTEELQTLNEELIATNEELSESNDHFARVNKELEQFAYVASHDLQEPLRKIQVFTNILNQKFAGELSLDASVYLEKITSSASRMTNLIKDLLDYSRLTYNSSLFRETDLNAIVTQIISDFELLITQKNVTLQVGNMAAIEAIPIQMNQLFYNLIGNAIKFSKRGVKPLITITARLLSTDDLRNYESLKSNREYQEITLSDNGIGFSQQYAEQIFTIFQRLNDKSKYGGYGIGLALCRRIVDNHNGIISAKGTENEGATFVLILPIKH